VKPGYKDGHTLVFKGQGNGDYEQNLSDLYVVIKEVKESPFRRVNDDIVYTHDITLVDSLNSTPISF
jgi:DnaJ-class molecular chaperone